MTVPAPPESTPPPAAPPVPAPPPSPPDPPSTDPPGEQQTFTADYVEKLRREAARYRTTAGEEKTAREALAAEKATTDEQSARLAALLDGITKAVNGDTGEPPDPARLAEQLAAEKTQRETDLAALTAAKDAEIRALTIRATLPAVAAKLGAHPALMQAVLTADGTLTKLDPGADTYTTDLESAVSAALEAHPQLKVAPVATRSGAEIPGRTGGSDQLTLDQVKAMKPADVEKARVAGRLRTILGG